MISEASPTSSFGDPASNGCALVRLRGYLDLATEADVARQLERAISSGASSVVVDLRELDFIDVVGTHALDSARRRCLEAGRRFFLVRGPRRVQRVLSLCRTDGEFDLLDDPADLAHL